MSLKITSCSPSFGIVSQRAVELARDKEKLNLKQIKSLVEAQDDNLKYHVTDSIGYDCRACYAVTNGNILERFKSLAAACNFATAVSNAAKENNAL